MNARLYELGTLEANPRGQRIGQLFCGKWTLEHLLGAGAAGEVYAARHLNGHRVAIKVALAKWAQFPQMRERFLTEARASNRVEHRAIVRVHDEGVAEDGSSFLVMDLLQGRTLGEYLERNGPLSPEQALLVAHEVLEALMATHEAGVLHRDIKPGNLFLNSDGRVLLVDFGIARLAESRALTQVGVPIGTPSFMPPEQAAGLWHKVDERTDLWSLGATLFTLLTGQAVRQVTTLADELQVASTIPARSLGTVRELPSAVVDLVDKALAIDPADRFDSAAAMRDAVRDAMTTLGISLPLLSELPGIRAGLTDFAASESVHPGVQQSTIRLRVFETTQPLPEDVEQWALRVKRGARFIRYALVPLALGAAAFFLWQSSQGGLQLEKVRPEFGALASVQTSAKSIVQPHAAALARQHTQQARQAVKAMAQLLDLLPPVFPGAAVSKPAPPQMHIVAPPSVSTAEPVAAAAGAEAEPVSEAEGAEAEGPEAEEAAAEGTDVEGAEAEEAPPFDPLGKRL